MNMRRNRVTVSILMAMPACWSLPDDRPVSLQAAGRGRQGAVGRGPHRSWRDPYPLLHAGRHGGDGQGYDPGIGGGDRGRDFARQYLSFDAAPRRRTGRTVGRTAPLDELG